MGEVGATIGGAKVGVVTVGGAKVGGVAVGGSILGLHRGVHTHHIRSRLS